GRTPSLARSPCAPSCPAPGKEPCVRLPPGLGERPGIRPAGTGDAPTRIVATGMLSAGNRANRRMALPVPRDRRAGDPWFGATVAFPGVVPVEGRGGLIERHRVDRCDLSP